MFTGNALWALIAQSDAMSCAVLLLLLCMSVICWAIALYLYARVRRIRAELRLAMQRLKSVDSIEQLLVVGQSMAETMAGVVITRALARTKTLLMDHTGTKQLTEHDIEQVRAELSLVFEELITQEERLLPILRTSAEVGPLVGLMGTVWGLIHSFMRISQEQSADIVTVAPGIAEALITTFMGLVVAIPALMLFHFLHARFQLIEHELMLLSERCAWIIQKNLQRQDVP